MKKINSKTLDLILAVLIIGTVFAFRVYDANKQAITVFFDNIKHPEVVTITECFVEDSKIKISAYSNGKFRDSNPNKEDNVFYLLEYEPFEDGTEEKRYISTAKKAIDLKFEIPLYKKDADPRRYYGDRKYNRFGVCVWNGKKYVLVSNLFYIEDKIKDYIAFDKTEIDESDINVFIVNPYDKKIRKLIKDDAIIRDYYKYYVPNVYEREGYDMIKEALNKIYKEVRLKHPYENINWFYGVNVNKQTDNYLAKSTVEDYSKNYYRSLRSFFTFIKFAKDDVAIPYAKDVDSSKALNAKDKVCILLDSSKDAEEIDTNHLNYDEKVFIENMKSVAKLYGCSLIYYANKNEVIGDKFNINKYVDTIIE